MLIDLLIALALALAAPLPPPVARTPLPLPEARTGKIVLYGPTWGDWTCEASEKCGIAARQNVRPAPGEWCVATWYREDLGRPGTLRIGTLLFRVRVCDYSNPADLPRILRLRIAGEIPYPLAQEIPGMIGSGWVTGTLTLQIPASTVSAASPISGMGKPAATVALTAPIRGRPVPR